MKKFTASMLSDGNHLFQASITILENGVKLRIPNFWRDEETYFNYNDISGVELTTPSWYSVLTYSTININLKGSWVEAHGFSKSDAIAIKKLIENNRQTNQRSTINEFGEDTSKFSSSKMKNWINYQHDRQMRLDREERISKRNEQNRELIPKLKKIITNSWIEILLYANNIDFDKLSQMQPPSNNKNAIKELNNCIDKLKNLIYEVNDEDYWEIEYKSINDEIWDEINNTISLKKAESKSFDKIGNEVSKKIEDILKQPEFDESFESKTYIQESYLTDYISYELRKIIRSYDILNIDLLEDSKNIKSNNKIVKQFVNKIYIDEERKDFHIIIEDYFEDKVNINYINELDDFFRIIKKIYKLGINKKIDFDGNLVLPYGLDSKSIMDFLKDKNNTLEDKLSKVIDVTDNLIDRVQKYYNL